MTVVVPHRAIEKISTSSDPKKAILEAVGDLSQVDIMFNEVLLGVYIRPEKTTGGIIRPTSNVQEDVWQGKVGLVLKWGNKAYVDDDEYHFDDGDKIKPGEWAVFMISDARSLNINGCPCRLVRDSNLKMRVKDPNIVF